MSSSNLTMSQVRDVPGFTGYRVDCLGNLWSCWSVKGFLTPTKWHKLKPVKRRQRLTITLRTDKGKGKMLDVGHVVLLGFSGLPDKGQVVCYRNGNKMDPQLSNVYWGQRRPWYYGAAGRRGSKNHMAKLNETKVLEIRCRAAKGESAATLARDFVVSTTTVYRIIRGERYGWLEGA